ncbi:MAG: ATP-dependent DNA helicase, partial [Candidatus Nealsonbacteria bacterium]|nr:ATP-dependent DNA helicase [Candidatus Nealsonbacteria bacterium]
MKLNGENMAKPSQNKFKIAYKQLNPEQKQAVEAIEGPVMVIAGPGTGKTHLLTMRIANILAQTDTPPEAVLALTFTESAVVSMRRKLSELIGSQAFRVNITTFHGFANDIIKNHPDDFPEIIGSTNIPDIDQVQIVSQIIDSLNLKNLKPFGNRYFYLRSIINAINELKQQGVLVADFSNIIEKQEKDFIKIEDLYHKTGAHKGKMKGKYIEAQKHILRNKELALIYADYQKSLSNSRFYDYSDMIMQVMVVLKKNKDLLLTLQEQYLYILVDEHQDTNTAQNKILELLANYHKNPNLFIVGDEKQAIFRFQGASMENFMYFRNLYKNVKLIALQRNYRSTQTILNAAYNLNSQAGLPANRLTAQGVWQAGKLLAKAGQKESLINLHVLPSFEAEQYFLAQSIKNLLKQKVPPGQIAVLYRENRDVIPIARILEKAGVPFIIESDQDVLNDEDIRKLLIILKAVQNFGSSAELIEMLHIDIFGIPPLDVYKIASLRSNPYDIIKNRKIMEKAGIEETDKLLEIYQKLSFWKSGAKNKGAVQAFEDVVRESGFLVYILNKPSSAEKLAKLHALFDQIKSLIENHKDYTLEHFFEYLDVIEEHNVLIKTTIFKQAPGRVRLMTAHKSKGLEFEYVYIINAVDGHWGSRRHYEHIKLPLQIYSLVEESFAGDSDEDERNLFYVALTRAKKQVSILYAKQNQNGREQLPSRFIAEIKPELIKEVDESKAIFEKRNELEFAPVFSLPSSAKEKTFLNELFYRQGLSVTALNNYLKCPWKYFYNNLLRIPTAPNKHLIFGTAVHGALKNFFDKFMKG